MLVFADWINHNKIAWHSAVRQWQKNSLEINFRKRSAKTLFNFIPPILNSNGNEINPEEHHIHKFPLRLSRGGGGAVEDGYPVEGAGRHHEEDLGCGGQALDLLAVLQRHNLANRKWGRVA